MATCAICLDYLREATIESTFCGHVYHVKCLRDWLKT